MARTFRNRPHWDHTMFEALEPWQMARDYGSCWCCSQKRQRLHIGRRDHRMKASDARRAAGGCLH